MNVKSHYQTLIVRMFFFCRRARKQKTIALNWPLCDPVDTTLTLDSEATRGSSATQMIVAACRHFCADFEMTRASLHFILLSHAPPRSCIDQLVFSFAMMLSKSSLCASTNDSKSTIFHQTKTCHVHFQHHWLVAAASTPLLLQDGARGQPSRRLTANLQG